MTESPTPTSMTEFPLDSGDWSWVREPGSVETRGPRIMTWRSVHDSDFWRLTAGGYVKHDGNALVTRVSGDFCVQASFDAKLETRYDQLGLVVLADESRWLKAGYELEGGEIWKGAVHTNEYSDWSCEPAALPAAVRVARNDGTIVVSSPDAQGEWRMLRQLFLDGDVAVGPYSAAPLGPGFTTRMTDFVLRADRSA